jgi:hypothetical protein
MNRRNQHFNQSANGGAPWYFSLRPFAEKPICCPLCGKAAIRLVAFTDAPGVLHMIGAPPTPCDSS